MTAALGWPVAEPSKASDCVLDQTEAFDLDTWMSRLADGDRSVFAQVFQTLWPALRKLCLNLLGNDADADDAAQQALEKILGRASEYDRSRPALPWALGIAGWECRTLKRQRSRRREAPEVALEVEQPVVEGLPEQLVVEQNLATAALAAMGHLSQVDQEALMATYWEEASSNAVTGATLRKRRERALKRLRAMFWRLYGVD